MFALEYIEGAMLTIAMLLYKIGSNAIAMLAPRAKAANGLFSSLVLDVIVTIPFSENWSPQKCWSFILLLPT